MILEPTTGQQVFISDINLLSSQQNAFI